MQVCRHGFDEESIRPGTLYCTNSMSMFCTRKMHRHHVDVSYLLTCTWSCSCFRYSMASSSMDALSVCTPKKHHNRNTIRSSPALITQLNNLCERARESEVRALVSFHWPCWSWVSGSAAPSSSRWSCSSSSAPKSQQNQATIFSTRTEKKAEHGERKKTLWDFKKWQRQHLLG